MTAPRTGKRKATEADAEVEACIKIARTHRPPHENGSSSVAAGADPWARLAATGGSASALGRGSLSGWTHCPLCGNISKKKHAIGRGIANHLKDVHTPWNPGKLAQKIHRRQYERGERERQRSRKRPRPVEDEVTTATQCIDVGNSAETNEADNFSKVVEAFKPLVSWTPTEEEEKAWVVKMMKILRKIEEEQTPLAATASNTLVALRKPDENSNTKSKEASEKKAQSDDKSGKLAIAYRDSLPPFLIAASKGNLMKLQELVKEAKEKDKRKPAMLSLSSQTEKGDENVTEVEKIQNDHHLRILLNTRDRHKSTADHWAAGGGHLPCHRYLYNLRSNLRVPDNHYQQDLEKKTSKVRRRDGKSCLHYAARNGHVHCIRYLLELEQSVRPGDENLRSYKLHTVDERSGEGTTPLHLACYGGHPRAVKHLVEEFGANPLSKNDWGCTCAHWAAMTLSESEADVKDLCGYLSKTCGISFVETQGQGHTALHKAAHRRNGHVIRWMVGSTSNGGAGLDSTAKEQAGAPDRGGHKPSDIWRRMGGDVAFAEWMKSSMGW